MPGSGGLHKLRRGLAYEAWAVDGVEANKRIVEREIKKKIGENSILV